MAKRGKGSGNDGQQQELGPGAPSLLRFFDVYEREHLVGARRAPATLASQRSAFNAIRRALASRELVEPLTPGAVFAWYRGRVERGELAESSANKHIEYLGMALRYARNFWPTVAIRDVTRDMPKFREPRRPPRVLAGDAAATLVALLDAMPGPLERAFLLVQTDDALRVSEALGLEGQDFDWQEQTVHIERQRKVDPRRGERVELKGEHSHATLPLSPRALEQLNLAMAARGQPWREGERVFPFGHRRLAELMAVCRHVSPESFPRRKRGVRGGLAWHAFRDTLGATLEREGYSARDGRALMRHGHESTTEGYFKNGRGEKVERELYEKAWNALSPEQRAAILAAGAERGAPRGPAGLRLVVSRAEQKGGENGRVDR